jgi:hypothetical protein
MRFEIEIEASGNISHRAGRSAASIEETGAFNLMVR